MSEKKSIDNTMAKRKKTVQKRTNNKLQNTVQKLKIEHQERH